jgi:diphthine methyl ester acylhydrolase
VEVNPHCSHVVATGSYDEHVRLWDMRALATPILTQKLSCGGGVWRLAWHPSEQDTLLAACMQNGFAVLRGGELWQSYCPGAKEGEHGSLGYGVGWCQPAPGRFAAVTASFYDRSLHVCSFE